MTSYRRWNILTDLTYIETFYERQSDGTLVKAAIPDAGIDFTIDYLQMEQPTSKRPALTEFTKTAVRLMNTRSKYSSRYRAGACAKESFAGNSP